MKFNFDKMKKPLAIEKKFMDNYREKIARLRVRLQQLISITKRNKTNGYQ